MYQTVMSIENYKNPTFEQLAIMSEQIEQGDVDCDGDCYNCPNDCALKTETIIFN